LSYALSEDESCWKNLNNTSRQLLDRRDLVDIGVAGMSGSIEAAAEECFNPSQGTQFLIIVSASRTNLNQTKALFHI
jgi:hypothetical protein